jgi:Polyketide cyclase / dehydrase and lipid transport
MASYETTIPAAWPADEMFRYLATFSNAERWDPGVLSGQALDAGPLRVGSRFRLVVPFAGRRLPLIYQITEYSERDRTVSLEATSMLLRARDVITVLADSEHGEATAVRYRAEVTLRGPLRLLDPLLAPGFGNVGDRAATALRGVLAAAPAPETPGAKGPS